MVGQDQIREVARVVEEAAEACDERDGGKRFAHLPRLRRPKHRIHIVQQKNLRLQRIGFQTRDFRLQTLGREEDTAGLPDAAEQCVQRVHGKRVEQAVGVRERRAADERDGGLKLDEAARQSLDLLRRYAGDLLYACRRVIRQAGGPAVNRGARASGISRPQRVREDDVREAEREDALGAGLHRHPLVGVAAGERHARFHLDERAAHPRATLAHRAVRGVLRHGRIPRAKKIGAETDCKARAREIDRGQLLVAEADRIGPAQHVFREEFIGDRRRRAEPFQQLRREREPAAAPRAREERERLLIVSRGQRVELPRELRDRLVPRDVPELAGAARAGPLHRVREAIGVIRDLNRRLPARAQAALADRILREPFELLGYAHLHDAGLPVASRLDVGFHHAHVQPAAGRAYGAHAGLPLRHAGNEIVVRHEADQLVLRVAAAGERCARAGDGRELDEVSALHAVRAFRPASNDMSNNRSTRSSSYDSSRRNPCCDRRRARRPSGWRRRRGTSRSRRWRGRAARG